MEWSEYKRRYGLVTALSWVAAVMVFIKITYRPPPGGYQPVNRINPLLTPTQAPTPTTAQNTELNETEVNYPLLELLPYTGKGFVADRYVAPRVLAIKIKGLDKILAAKEIAEWMEENGVDPASHDIQWEN